MILQRPLGAFLALCLASLSLGGCVNPRLLEDERAKTALQHGIFWDRGSILNITA